MLTLLLSKFVTSTHSPLRGRCRRPRSALHHGSFRTDCGLFSKCPRGLLPCRLSRQGWNVFTGNNGVVAQGPGITGTNIWCPKTGGSARIHAQTVACAAAGCRLQSPPPQPSPMLQRRPLLWIRTCTCTPGLHPEDCLSLPRLRPAISASAPRHHPRGSPKLPSLNRPRGSGGPQLPI